jgi:hypothetical protein
LTYESRLPVNYAFGVLTSAAAISDTTLTSTDFATRLPSGLSTTTYVPITLQDPSTGLFEIVWANAHTAAATTCTVLRGREGTSARAWGSGTLWVVAPTLRDGVLPVANAAALPADPHVGLRAFLQDTQTRVEYVLNVGWLAQSGMAYRANTLLGADTPSVTMSGIPSTLKKLQIVWSARSTQAVAIDELRMRINNDGGTNYFSTISIEQNATITPSNNNGYTYFFAGHMAGASAVNASGHGSGEIVIPGWDAPGSRAAVNLHWHSHTYDTAANSSYAQGGGLYNATGPWTSVMFFPSTGNLKAGSEFTIYGWG